MKAAIYARVSTTNHGQDVSMQTRELREYCERRGWTATTGAGDVFHGAFCYAVLQGMPMRETLEFSNAMAALNCTRIGARGGIATAPEARALIERGERRAHPDYSAAAHRA